jgi:hypothetical protein
MELSERPNGAFDRQASGDLYVFKHVLGVIDVHETVAKRLSENEPDDCSKKNTNSENQPTILPGGRSAFGLKRYAPAWMAGSGIFSRFAAHLISVTRSFGPAMPNSP